MAEPKRDITCFGVAWEVAPSENNQSKLFFLTGRHIGLEFGNLLSDYFVLSQFPFKKGLGHLCLFLNAARGQLIEIGAFVVRIPEILDLDHAHLNQGLQAVVGLAQGYTHDPGQVPLTDLRLLLDDFKDAVAGIKVHGGGAGSRGKIQGARGKSDMVVQFFLTEGLPLFPGLLRSTRNDLFQVHGSRVSCSTLERNVSSLPDIGQGVKGDIRLKVQGVGAGAAWQSRGFGLRGHRYFLDCFATLAMTAFPSLSPLSSRILPLAPPPSLRGAEGRGSPGVLTEGLQSFQIAFLVGKSRWASKTVRTVT